MKAQNLLIIMSDQHSRGAMGCYGHPVVQTPEPRPAGGARHALHSVLYTPSPVCVPARAAFATGKYVHQIGYWDNADAYDGSIPSWHHRLREARPRSSRSASCISAGDEDDHGFSEEIIPMHIVDGKGDLMGLVRATTCRSAARPTRWRRWPARASRVYTQYDRDIAARAQIWLREEAPQAYATSRGCCSFRSSLRIFR